MALPIWALMAGVGAASKAVQARQNQTRQNKLDDFRKAAITYSPWTGLGDPGAQSAGNTSMFGGALQGAEHRCLSASQVDRSSGQGVEDATEEGS